MSNKRGQVWIETVTYTLVAFVLIGLVLSFAKPKIDELQDQAILEQSIGVMKDLDGVINEVFEKGVGNKRKIEVLLRKGDLTINSSNNSFIFEMESSYMYSQPNQTYTEGNLEIFTSETGKNYNILIKRSYSALNITYNLKEESKIIPKSSTPYFIFVSNKGGSNINFEIE